MRRMRFKPIYIATGLLLVAVLGITVVHQMTLNDEQKEEITSNQSEEDDSVGSLYIEKPVDHQVEDEVISNVEEDTDVHVGKVTTTEKQEEKKTTTTKTAVETAPVFAFSNSSKLAWPVKGNVILPYSMTQTVYFATLDQYKCNPAVLIGVKTGTDITAAASGTVTAISNTVETGKTITVDIGSGYQTIYGNCQNLTVQKGDTVTVGTKIAEISDPTRYYLVEGSNLYFQLLKNSNPVNPTTYFQN